MLSASTVCHNFFLLASGFLVLSEKFKYVKVPMMFHGVTVKWCMDLSECRPVVIYIVPYVISHSYHYCQALSCQEGEEMRMVLNPASTNIASNKDLCGPPAVG